MKLLQVEPAVYHNADYVYSIIEAPYLGNKKQITVYVGNKVITLRMSAADFINQVESGKSIIDLTPYFMS